MAVDFDATVLASSMKAFGQAVTYLPGAGPPVALSGVFNRHFQQVKLVAEMEEITIRPALGCRASQLPGKPAENEQFIIGDQVYAVKEVDQDGLGHYTIYLHGPL